MKLEAALLEQITNMEPVDFAGLAKLMGVKIVEDDFIEEDGKKKFIPRDFADVLDDLLKKYETLGRDKKREILKLVKKANAVKRRR